mgnify:CR=1 FL=1
MNTTTVKRQVLFCNYYEQWITVYKEGAIRPVTMKKYKMAHQWLVKLVPDMLLEDLDRISYQKLLNDYAEEHEHQTTLDFHHHVKCAILDAVDEGLISRDPTRKAIIKGKKPRDKKPKYLNQFELHKLIEDLELEDKVTWDWFLLLVSKTGMRFSEALALTPKDFDFSHQTLSISKTWDYKGNGGFLPTKNKSSVRKIQMDWLTVMQFARLVKNLPEDEPIFVEGTVYNSTVNGILERHCKNAGIPKSREFSACQGSSDSPDRKSLRRIKDLSVHKLQSNRYRPKILRNRPVHFWQDPRSYRLFSNLHPAHRLNWTVKSFRHYA